MSPLSVDLIDLADRDWRTLVRLLRKGLQAEVHRLVSTPMGGICNRLLDTIALTAEHDSFARQLSPTAQYAIKRFLVSAVNDQHDLKVLMFWVIVTLFDNFAPGIEYSEIIPVPQSVSGFAFFHELGARVSLDVSEIRVSSTARSAKLEGVELRRIPTSPHRWRTDRSETITYSTYADRVLFAAVPNNEIDEEADLSSCQTAVSAAVDLIEMSVSAIYRRIVQRKLWLIPLRSVASDVHRSFSSPDLLRAVFMSMNGKTWQLAEAIVHEFSHTELNTYSCLGPLTSDSDTLFYSPWRPDPRPMNGLLHALFVFCEVWLFLERVRPEAETAEQNIIATRQVLYAHRLKLGLAQIRYAVLTPKGQALHHGLTRRIGEIAEFTEAAAGRSGIRQVAEHLETFQKENPDVQVTAVC